MKGTATPAGFLKEHNVAVFAGSHELKMLRCLQDLMSKVFCAVCRVS